MDGVHAPIGWREETYMWDYRVIRSVAHSGLGWVPDEAAGPAFLSVARCACGEVKHLAPPPGPPKSRNVRGIVNTQASDTRICPQFIDGTLSTLTRVAATFALFVALTASPLVTAQESTPEATEHVAVSTEAPVDGNPEPGSESDPGSDSGVDEAEPVADGESEPSTEAAAPTEADSESETSVAESEPAAGTIESTTAALSETPEVAPALAYSLLSDSDCHIVPDQPTEVLSGGALDLTCRESIGLHGNDIVPDGITVIWQVDLSIGAGWELQVLAPANPGERADWSPPQPDSATFTFTQQQPAGAGSDPAVIDTSTGIAFHVRLLRLICSLDAPELLITRQVSVQSADTEVDPIEAAGAEPLRFQPVLHPIPDPAVTFNGPLLLGEVATTAAGATDPVRAGTVTLIISDLDDSCGAWSLQLVASQLTDEQGDALIGSSLMIVAINGDVIPDGGCDLAPGCDVLTVQAGPDGPETLSIELGIELRMPSQPDTGVFQTALSAALQPVTRD
jgi:hypothetical protein